MEQRRPLRILTDSVNILITIILSKEKPDCVANYKLSVAHALQSFEAADDLERIHMEARSIAALAIAVSAASQSASAQSKRIGGAGGESCASFLNRSGKDGLSDTAALQWVLGYLSGRSVATDKIHRPFEGPDGIAKPLNAYCRAHPDLQIEDAAGSYFD